MMAAGISSGDAGFPDSVALWPRGANGVAYEYKCTRHTCLWNYPRQLGGLATVADGIFAIGRPMHGVQRVGIVGSAYYNPKFGPGERGAKGFLKGRSWMRTAGVATHGHKIVWTGSPRPMANTFGIEGPAAFVRGRVWMIASRGCHAGPCTSSSGYGLLWIAGRRWRIDHPSPTRIPLADRNGARSKRKRAGRRSRSRSRSPGTDPGPARTDVELRAL